jgi:hypothetical protein
MVIGNRRDARFLARVIGLLTGIVLLAFGTPATAETSTGTLIVTLNAPVTEDGAVSDRYRAYFIRAKRVDGSEETQILYEQSLIIKSPNDFAASGGKGTVFTKDISAGDWVVYLVQVEQHTIHLRPTKEFAIPFTLRAGRATYIGSFTPVVNSNGDDGPRFVVTDQSARDLPIARAHKPDLGPVDVSVFDVNGLNTPLFSSQTGGAVSSDSLYCRYMNLLGCVKL